MQIVKVQTAEGRKFNPLTNRLLIYLFCGILSIGYFLDLIFVELQPAVFLFNLINILLSLAIVVLFYFKKVKISLVVKIQIIGLLANLLLSYFFNPVDTSDYAIMFIRNAIIMFFFIPVYGLYCGKNHIFTIGIAFLVLYIAILARTNNLFLANNAPILIFGAVIYHVAIYYIFDVIEKMQFAQIGLNESLESQKNQLMIINQDLEQKNQHIYEQSIELKQLLATKDKIFSIIAHDLRSPFNSILGFSELLMENTKENQSDKASKYATIINSEAKSTIVVLENLLNWTKSQTGKIVFNPERLMLKSVVRTHVNSFEFSAKLKNISLNYLLSEDIQVYADQNMIGIIFRNLISNAIKFSFPNGKIDVFAQQSSNYVKISISDNGMGMSEEKCKRLFDFDEIQTTPGTAKEKGSGLGLILCKEFVEKHGGKIEVESEEGQGSCFNFTIPLI